MLGLVTEPLTAATAADVVTGVRVDSRLVSPGDLFVAVAGGERFVADARARGASTLVPADPFRFSRGVEF